MTESVVIAVISLLGTVAGSYSATRHSHRLLEYRIEQLENKLDTCTNLIERVTAVETKLGRHVA